MPSRYWPKGNVVGTVRGRARVLALVGSGALAVTLGLSAPAGAANPYQAHRQLSVASHASVPHVLAALSIALVNVTDDATGNSTEEVAHSVQPAINASIGSCLSLNANAVCLSFTDGVTPGFFGFGSINGPGVYTAPTSVRVQVGGLADFCSVNFSAEVDQYQFASGTEQAVGVQFDCDNGTTDISGAIAYNIFPTDPNDGYYIFGQAGELAGFGNDNYLVYLLGAADVNLNAPIVAMAPMPDGAGYWMVGSDGGVFASGDAQFYGSTGNIRLNQPIVGMAATSNGGGYWFVASDGGIFSYGNALFHGSAGAMRLNKPIVGMAPTPSGNGYWLVASDGGIFAYGDAQFYGSTGGTVLNKPIVGMAPTPSGHGYWLVASDGGIFAYGYAQFYGSTGAIHLNQPIVGMVPTRDGGGYWFVALDGGVFNYGDAPFVGSLGGSGVNDAAGLSLGN